MAKNYAVPCTAWGRKCKAAIALKGITLKELAESIGYTPQYISAIINGRYAPPMETVEAISKALDVPISEFVS
jgi:transcriptional regulator with XRE-family HTH domain